MPGTRPQFTKEQSARFAEAVVESIRTPMVVADRQLRVLAVSPPFRELLATPDDPRGHNLLSLDGGWWDLPELRQALSQVLTHEQSFDDMEVTSPGGDILYVSARALPTQGGKPELILAGFDRADSHVRTGSSLDDMGFAEEIVATVREPFLVLDYDHCVRMANQSFYREFRVSPKDVIGRHLTDLGNGAWDIPELRQRLDEVLSKDRLFNDFEVEHEFAGIGRRIMLLNARRIDHLRLILLAIEDVTERRQQERQQQMLVSELAHRVQNLLAIVQSLVSQTRAGSVEEFRTGLNGRLRALAMAHGLLFESRWRKGELEAVLHQITEPYIENASDRVRIAGPAITLSADQVTGLALILNELATNATKYGALSNNSGLVEISWAMTCDQLRLNWHETGVPMVDPSPPAGFGRTLIDRTASYYLGGWVELEFEPTGLVCRLAFPLAD